MKPAPNHPAAGKAGTASLLAVGHHWPAPAGEQLRKTYTGRWAASNTTPQIILMKKHIHGLLLASTLALVFTGCATSSNTAAWEYKVVTPYADAATVEKQINDLTQQGWHLVSIAAGGGDVTHTPQAVIVFKRHK